MNTKRQKALATKKDTLKQAYCQYCSAGIIRDGTQGRKKFCNDACKMKYHRAVKAYRQRINPAPERKAVFDRSAQQIINIAWSHLAEMETAL